MDCIRYLGNICNTPLCGICVHAIKAVESASGKTSTDLEIVTADSGRLLKATDPDATGNQKKFFYVSDGFQRSIRASASRK